MKQVSDRVTASKTWQEIHAQPVIWRDWADAFGYVSLRDWFDAEAFEEVWFCGAGTSAYIGDIIASGLTSQGALRFRSVPSTDLVARPKETLTNAENVLIVNFGRSGNSSETIGTLDAVAALAPDVGLLNITCNSDSALAHAKNGKTIVLPEACHDAGFAMTSSFSTMLLTALAIFDRGTDVTGNLGTLAALATQSLPRLAEDIAALQRPTRAVFVGSGPMAFAARESALKVMELSAGQIPALWDSTLGFRHGPKSFVTDDTAIFVLLSPDPYTAKYDQDLVAELRIQFPKATVMMVGAEADLEIGSTGDATGDTVLSVLPAQLASVIWSAQLGLNIDDPFVGKSNLSRVVSGVQLHPIKVAG